MFEGEGRIILTPIIEIYLMTQLEIYQSKSFRKQNDFIIKIIKSNKKNLNLMFYSYEPKA